MAALGVNHLEEVGGRVVPRKTIEQVRAELRKAKETTRELRMGLKTVRRAIWNEAAALAIEVKARYPTDIWPPPEPDCDTSRYAAAGCRIAADIIVEESLRRAKEGS